MEAASLSAVALPAVDPAIAAEVAIALAPCIANGSLSQLQVEGVLLAAARHAQDLPDGTRAGFFLGDSAGVGKGRQIAALILFNYLAGRRRSLWVSTSSDLVNDARRDMRALCALADGGALGGTLAGAPFFGGGGGGGGFRVFRDGGGSAVAAPPAVPIYAGPDEAVKAGTRAGGTIFATYAMMSRKGRVSQKRGGGAAAESRLDQVVAWLAKASPTGRPEDFDGLIVFDER